MVELSTPIKSWKFHGIRLQSKGCRFNSCPFQLIFFPISHYMGRYPLSSLTAGLMKAETKGFIV